MNTKIVKEDLRKWFSKDDPEGGWKRINSKGEAIGPCAREPGEPKPKCMSNEKRAQLSKKQRASAVAAKRKHDPNPERKGKPINVSNFGKGKISEAMEKLDEKNVPTSPEKWARAKAQAKAKFDVYPSAYANGWAAKKYKAMGGSWKSVSESVKIKSFKSFLDSQTGVGDELEEGLRHKLAAIGVAASLAAGAAHGQDTRRITPGESENRFPNAQQTDVKKDNERKKTVTPPSKEYLHGVIKGDHPRPLFTKERAKELLKKHYDEDIKEERTPAWQRKEGKNPEGGLNKAGIASYRADNPGSKLSLAVTTKPSKLKKGSKAANRRKSFCARMSGMKKRLTSAKTARDPDSRINKALRKWNC